MQKQNKIKKEYVNLEEGGKKHENSFGLEFEHSMTKKATQNNKLYKKKRKKTHGKLCELSHRKIICSSPVPMHIFKMSECE